MLGGTLVGPIPSALQPFQSIQTSVSPPCPRRRRSSHSYWRRQSPSPPHANRQTPLPPRHRTQRVSLGQSRSSRHSSEQVPSGNRSPLRHLDSGAQLLSLPHAPPTSAPSFPTSPEWPCGGPQPKTKPAASTAKITTPVELPFQTSIVSLLAPTPGPISTRDHHFNAANSNDQNASPPFSIARETSARLRGM